MGSAPRRTVFLHEYVTGGGLAGSPLPASWAAEGGAMRRALAEDFAALPGARVVTTLDARLPDEPGPWEVVRVGPVEESAVFARLAAEADCTVVIAPETGGVLAERARRIERAGGRSLGSSPAAIVATGDKLGLDRLLRPLGSPMPAGRPVVPAEGLPRDFAYPAVLKPIDGAGAVATFVIDGPDACPAEAMALPTALLQPLVPGTPMSAAFLVDADGRAVLVGIARQDIDCIDGRFRYRGGAVLTGDGVPTDDVRGAVAAVPGLRGWVGVDFLWDGAEGRVTLLEINPRLTTSYVGYRALLPPGALAAAWLAAVEGAAWDGADLARRIRAGAPLTFAADGTILAGGRT